MPERVRPYDPSEIKREVEALFTEAKGVVDETHRKIFGNGGLLEFIVVTSGSQKVALPDLRIRFPEDHELHTALALTKLAKSGTIDYELREKAVSALRKKLKRNPNGEFAAMHVRNVGLYKGHQRQSGYAITAFSRESCNHPIGGRDLPVGLDLDGMGIEDPPLRHDSTRGELSNVVRLAILRETSRILEGFDVFKKD